MFGLWQTARANRENILYTIVTVFLLERVRRGWNRIGHRADRGELALEDVERKQQWFMFRAAMLYAVPLLLPMVKYVFRSATELSTYVPALAGFSNVWSLIVVAVLVESFLAIVIYNLLGIYVEHMNRAFGVFGWVGKRVASTSQSALNAGVAAGAKMKDATVNASGVVAAGLRKGVRGAFAEGVKASRATVGLAATTLTKGNQAVGKGAIQVAEFTRSAGRATESVAAPAIRWWERHTKDDARPKLTPDSQRERVSR